MSSIEESIVVGAPIQSAYNQWTRFEEFPDFMKGVREVVQIDDGIIRFSASLGGVHADWEARIVEQVPDHHITWRSVAGAENGGTVFFKELGPRTTRVTLILDYHPGNWMEKAGDALGIVRRRVQDDLARFKRYIEARDQEPSGWRGEIHAGLRRH